MLSVPECWASPGICCKPSWQVLQRWRYTGWSCRLLGWAAVSQRREQVHDPPPPPPHPAQSLQCRETAVGQAHLHLQGHIEAQVSAVWRQAQRLLQ